MIIGLEGFGSIWSARTRSGAGRSAFYNTTGIVCDGRLRHRSRVFGQLRFNEVGGFNPRLIERNIGRVFRATENRDSQRPGFLFHHMLSNLASPDCFLFAITSERTGELHIDMDGWKSDGVRLISLSQFAAQQEAMFLMPVYGWIRGELGRFVVEPFPERPWRASLELRG